jgi:hypothetical protein
MSMAQHPRLAVQANTACQHDIQHFDHVASSWGNRRHATPDHHLQVSAMLGRNCGAVGGAAAGSRRRAQAQAVEPEFNSRLRTRTRAGIESRRDPNDSAPAPCGVSSVLDLRLFGEGARAIRPVLSN